MEDNKLRIGWFCTYVPDELIHATGLSPYRILPQKEGGAKEKYLPPNFCPYVRNVIEEIEENEDLFRAIVVATSCNAMLHLYNVIKENFYLPVHLLHVPKNNSNAALKYYSTELIDFKEFLENINGEINYNFLLNSIIEYDKTTQILEKHWTGLDKAFLLQLASTYSDNFIDFFYDLYHEKREIFNSKLESTNFSSLYDNHVKKADEEFILLGGALPSKSLLKIIENELPYPILIENCLGSRYLSKRNHKNHESFKNTKNINDLLYYLAGSYLNKPPCPRFYSFEKERIKLYEELINTFNLKAIIYHELSFCDHSNYEYLRLKNLIQKNHNVPVLKINSELQEQNYGQFKTRLEAFLEMIID